MSKSSLPIVQLAKGKDKPVRQGHPWIFTGAIKKLPEFSETCWVRVYSAEGEALGVGIFAPNDSLCIRLFVQGKNDTPPSIDELVLRIHTAMRQRQFSTDTNAYRLLHAEGDNLPGLVIDKYDRVAILQCAYTSLLPELAEALAQALPQYGIDALWLKGDAWISIFQNTTTVLQTPPDFVQVSEYGIPFFVPIHTGQKTGLFLDQRENRNLVRTRSQNKTVLNLFSYTGGFSLAALAGGAKHAISIDVSASALEWGKKSAALMKCEDKCTWQVADCFEYLRENKSIVDIAVVDPPAFAKSKQAIDQAARGYKDINRLALEKVAPGGELFTYSCSQKINPTLFQQIIFAAALEAGRQCRIVRRLQAGTDHPIGIYCPEGEYLKGFHILVD